MARLRTLPLCARSRVATLEKREPWMAQFATTDDLAARIGRDIPADRLAFAARLLKSASSMIQLEARQTIELVEDHEVVLTGNWTEELWLPERPVLAVSSIQIGSDPELATADFEWRRGGLAVLLHRSFTMAPAPSGVLGGLYWGGPEVGVAVTYSHGYAEIPEDLETICLEAAVRAFGNPATDKSEQVEKYIVDHGDVRGVQLTDDEKRVARRYRPVLR